MDVDDDQSQFPSSENVPLASAASDVNVLRAGGAADSPRVEARLLQSRGSGSIGGSPLGSLMASTSGRMETDAHESLGRLPAVGSTSYSDRFIPSRAASNLAAGFAMLEQAPLSERPGVIATSEQKEDGAAAYSMLLRSVTMGAEASTSAPSTPEKLFRIRGPVGSPGSPGSKLFHFKTSRHSPGGAESPFSLTPVGADPTLTGGLSSPRRIPHKIARSPFKVLDAPALADDFYLNLVDWSAHNVVAVGLGTCVYLWSAATSKVTKLCDLGQHDTVCSVSWTQRGTYLAVGTNLGEVQIWDAAKCKRVRTMGGHRIRVGTLSWSSALLSSGSRDRSILQRDVRTREDFAARLLSHKSEVCGLRWSCDDRELASGGNDNQLFVWNPASTQPVLRFSEHTAAVKAIAWSPHQHGLLASGGGTADRCIRFWSTTSNTALAAVDTGSQVCNLVWSKNVNELVSTHGYSQNQIVVWRYPTMSKLATLTGHTLRVLYLALSPDGQIIVTGAGDETLRFWSVFPGPKAENKSSNSNVWSGGRTLIR